jgi:hypothetical protein
LPFYVVIYNNNFSSGDGLFFGLIISSSKSPKKITCRLSNE